MSLFNYAIEVWACTYDSKHLSQIDRFCKRVVKYGYAAKFTPIADLIRERDLKLWKKVTTYNHCLKDLLPMKRTRSLWDRGHNYVLPHVRTERFKWCFINKCLRNFV